jgi:N-acetylgalactosamine-6-sulfatase
MENRFTIRSTYPRVMRNHFVSVIYMFFVCSLLLAGCKKTDIKSKPNTIFILTDDQGYGDMGVAGHPYMLTPNLDRLAEEGTRFTQFYVNSTVCAPSRVALMTGHFPARHNVHHIYGNKELVRSHGVPDFLDPDVLTVADIMKQAGYTTGHIGKWHLCGNGDVESPEASEYGFDFDMISTGCNRCELYRERWESTEHQLTLSSHWMVADAIDFISQSREIGEPFYLNLWTHVPHAPLNPTSEELAVYDDLHANPHDFTSWMVDYADSAGNLDSQMKIFCASMTSMDAALGKLLDYLDESGLSENTLIFFTSDNGPEDYHVGNASNAGMGSPGIFRGRKRSTYEGGIRVPCIVRWPGHVAAGKVSDAVWSGVDWLPTLARIIGIELPEGYQPDGEDVSDIFYGSDRGHNKPLYWEWKFPVRSVKDYSPPQLAILEGQWKFYCNPDGSRPELYDLEADLEQRNNVVSEEPEIVARLKASLLAWKKTIPETAYTSDKK